MRYVHRLLCWIADDKSKIYDRINSKLGHNIYWKISLVLLRLDNKYRGTYNYLGSAYFWAYAYKHILRNFWDYPKGTRMLRLLHTAMLDAQMDVVGESDAHLRLIMDFAYALDPNERW